jgi:two-component system LytT family response regulator
MLKALIVDDEELARRGLEIRLQKFDDVEVSGECRNGRETVSKYCGGYRAAACRS